MRTFKKKKKSESANKTAFLQTMHDAPQYPVSPIRSAWSMSGKFKVNFGLIGPRLLFCTSVDSASREHDSEIMQLHGKMYLKCLTFTSSSLQNESGEKKALFSCLQSLNCKQRGKWEMQCVYSRGKTAGKLTRTYENNRLDLPDGRPKEQALVGWLGSCRLRGVREEGKQNVSPAEYSFTLSLSTSSQS